MHALIIICTCTLTYIVAKNTYPFMYCSYNIIGGVDYDPGPYSIIFSAGGTSKSFNITIFDNNTFESLESFNLLISPHALILLGSPHQAVTTIRDDDGRSIKLYI